MNSSASWNFNTTVDSDGQVFGTGAWNETANQFGVIVLEDRDGSVTFTSPVMNSGDLVVLCISCTSCFNGIDGKTCKKSGPSPKHCRRHLSYGEPLGSDPQHTL